MISDSRKRSASSGTVLFMVASVVFAGLSGVLISRLLGQNYSQEPLQPAVVAARDVPAGRALTAVDLRVAQWPASSIPRGAFATQEQLLKGAAVPLVPLVEGAAVLKSYLSQPHSGIGVAAKIGGGQRAVAIRTDASLALARLLYPGAKVDVLSTIRERDRDGSRTKTILQNVTVLAVGPDIDAASAARTSGNNAGRRGGGGGGAEQQAARRVVTLAVTPDEAERLVLASRDGVIDMVLRSPQDSQIVMTPGATPSVLVGTREDEERGASGVSP